MADVNRIVPFILKWESGVKKLNSESNEVYFERCKKKGWANDPLDKGGATMCGVTIGAYKAWCIKEGRKTPTTADLKAISYADWLSVLKKDYWDRWKADDIVNQGIANICVDFVWASGKYGITKVQSLLGVTADGIVGRKTIAALNSKPPVTFFNQIKKIRIAFVNGIVKNNPSQKKWLKGWTNRINDIEYME